MEKQEIVERYLNYFISSKGLKKLNKKEMKIATALIMYRNFDVSRAWQLVVNGDYYIASEFYFHPTDIPKNVHDFMFEFVYLCLHDDYSFIDKNSPYDSSKDFYIEIDKNIYWYCINHKIPMSDDEIAKYQAKYKNCRKNNAKGD